MINRLQKNINFKKLYFIFGQAFAFYIIIRYSYTREWFGFDILATLLYSSMGLFTALFGTKLNGDTEFIHNYNTMSKTAVKLILIILGMFPLMFIVDAALIWIFIMILQGVLSLYLLINLNRLPQTNDFEKLIKGVLFFTTIAIIIYIRVLARIIEDILFKNFTEISKFPLPIAVIVLNFLLIKFEPNYIKADETEELLYMQPDE